MVLSREPDEEVDLAIRITYLCKELHVLPSAGGLLDQDPYMIKLLTAGLNAMHEKERREAERARRQ